MKSFDKIAALRLRYINLVLDGVEAGDSWFSKPMDDILRWWPELVADEQLKRAR